MKLLKRILIVLVLLIVILVGVGYGLYKYNNKRVTPDYYEIYKTQDTVPEGKVGIFVTALIMPPKHDNIFWYNITHKIFKTIIPWPFRIFAKQDTGIALIDPTKYYEFEEFTPTVLEDHNGSECFLDGEPYINKYRQGEVVWVPPSRMIHKDCGFFVYKTHKGGMPTRTGKSINKSRVWYYDKGIKQKTIPHWEGSFRVINETLKKIEEQYGGIEWRASSSLYYQDMKEKIHELLDAGCDTIVLTAPMGIYSHFEEFNSGFYHTFEYIHEWEKEHPGKKIKVIMTPPMGEFEPLRKAYLTMLKDRLDTLPKGADVTVAVTVHGMPWDTFPWEAWLDFAPVYRDTLVKEVEEMLTAYDFGRKTVILCQDEFASHVWDPDDKYLSTNEAYWNAINDGYDYVIGLPIEFFAENTDSLFYHAIKNYEGFDEYHIYDPFDYPDWSVPFTMEFQQGKTRVIYNGVPVGKYRPYVVEAFYLAIDSILNQRKS